MSNVDIASQPHGRQGRPKRTSLARPRRTSSNACYHRRRAERDLAVVSAPPVTPKDSSPEARLYAVLANSARAYADKAQGLDQLVAREAAAGVGPERPERPSLSPYDPDFV